MARIDIDGLKFDNVTTAEATDQIVELAQKRDGKARYACTGNLDHLAIADFDAAFKQAYLDADFVVADGAPVVWLSKLAGQPLKERVAGSELFWTLARASHEKGVTLFFLGGKPGAAEAAEEKLKEQFPNLKVVGKYCPPFETFNTQEEQDRIVAEVRKADPDILMVAFGAPKQEKWIHQNREKLGVPVSIGLGGSFEMAAGYVKRAPVWMQKTGLEWFYRFAQEPKRLYERYIVRDIPHLAKATARIAKDRLASR